jgi:hypothetical protein
MAIKPFNIIGATIMLACVFLQDKLGNWLWIPFFGVIFIGLGKYYLDKRKKV